MHVWKMNTYLIFKTESTCTLWKIFW